MATNYIQEGGAITVTAPSGGTTSGLGVKIGSLFGVAATTQLINEDVVLLTEGVFELVKVGSQAWSVGDPIYWNDTSKYCTTTASGNLDIGVCVEAVGSGSGDTLGKVRLNNRAVVTSGGGVASTVTIALAAGATNSMDATITVKDGTGATVAAVHNLEMWMSGASTGIDLTSSSYSGSVTASTGKILTAITAKKHLMIQTAATGIAVINIVASAKPATEYVCVRSPSTSQPVVSAASGTSWGA